MSKVKLPSFLRGNDPVFFLTNMQRESVEDTASNWIKLHAVIKSYKPTPEHIASLRRFMYAEYLRDGGPRLDIVRRLHERFNRLRREYERAQIGG